MLIDDIQTSRTFRTCFKEDMKVTDVTIEISHDGRGKPFYCIVGWEQPKSRKMILDYSRTAKEAIEKAARMQAELIETAETEYMRITQEREERERAD